MMYINKDFEKIEDNLHKKFQTPSSVLDYLNGLKNINAISSDRRDGFIQYLRYVHQYVTSRIEWEKNDLPRSIQVLEEDYSMLSRKVEIVIPSDFAHYSECHPSLQTIIEFIYRLECLQKVVEKKIGQFSPYLSLSGWVFYFTR